MNIEKIAVRARIGRKPRMVKTFDVIEFLKTFLWILFDIFFSFCLIWPTILL